jgi:hypothetical protein
VKNSTTSKLERGNNREKKDIEVGRIREEIFPLVRILLIIENFFLFSRSLKVLLTHSTSNERGIQRSTLTKEVDFSSIKAILDLHS